MKITWGLGLGRIESVHDYEGVLIPLEQAHHHSYSARIGRTEFEAPAASADDDDEEADKDADNETQGMLNMHAAEYTIEGLRKETRSGRQGKWTEYEIKSKLINKAIQDIGMGRYNWQLFTLCGFGWFADK